MPGFIKGFVFKIKNRFYTEGIIYVEMLDYYNPAQNKVRKDMK